MASASWVRRLSGIMPQTADTWVAFVFLPAACGGLLWEAYNRTELGDADIPGNCSYARTSRLLTPLHVRKLEQTGCVIVRGALTPIELAGVRKNVQAMPMDPSGNDVDVRQDRLVWVRNGDNGEEEDGAKPYLTHAIQLIRGVGYALEVANYDGADDLLVPQDCQVAVYPGDGSAGYDRHLDRCNGTLYDLGLLEYWRLSDVRNRVVTVILYLNDEDRRDSEGGALRCWMDGEGPFFDVQPTGGTLIVFDASRLHHQVLPSQTKRTAITCWINGALK